MTTANATATAHEEVTTQTTGNGREKNGRFARGNPGGPGNPFARQIAAFRKAIVGALTPQDFVDIVLALLAKARSGDVPAAKLLFAYALGKPTDAVHPDRIDADEWERLRETAPMMSQMSETALAPPADLLVGLARDLRPIVGNVVKDKMGETIRSMLADPKCQRATSGDRAPSQSASNGWHVPRSAVGTDAAAGDDPFATLEELVRAACSRPLANDKIGDEAA